MKHAILGAGGVGGLVGAALSHEGEDVSMVVRPGTLQKYSGTLHVESRSVQKRILLRDGIAGVRRTLGAARVPWLEIETGEGLQINLDGEPLTEADAAERLAQYGRNELQAASQISPWLGKSFDGNRGLMWKPVSGRPSTILPHS